MSLQAARSLFEACIELSADERIAWLAAHCADESLRGRVTRLLQAHDDAQARDALRRARALPADQQIGPYRLLERIGEGAMGEVYLAEQTAPVVRRVALKVIKSGMDSGEVLARFDLERQTLALMSHPSIAHIIDAGTTATGRPYFAMEYVPGIPLTRYCDQHRLTIDARLGLFLQICDAIQHAHQKGVIHRDLKPGNLLVTDLDGRPMPKVIDFGIAKAVAPGRQPSAAHTRIGYLIGTPEYMSPEQAQLSPLDVDTRSDVYSLGVVLHELLTGTLPFQICEPGSTPAQIVQELLTHDPAAPSTRIRAIAREPDADPTSASRRGLTPRQLAARLTGDLDWIVLRSLEKDRNRRYGSPSELAADLRRHLANEPVLAGPPSTAYRLRKFASRHRLALAVLCGLFVATLLFGGAMAYQAREVARQRDEATFQAQRAEASSEFMSLMLEEVGPAGKPLTLLELLDRGEQLLDKQYGADPRFRARMLLQMSRRYQDLGNTERQHEALSRAEAIASELRDDELLAQANCTAVGSDLDANRHEQARQRMVTARLALARVARPPAAVRVDCLRAEADVANLERDREAAIANLTQARALLEKSASTRGLQYNAVLTDLGGIYFRTGRFREALELNRQTREALERNGRSGTLASVTLSVNHASILYRLGEIRRAREVGLAAIERLRTLREHEHAAPPASVSYGITLNRLERPEEAIEFLTAARNQAAALGNQFWGARATFQLGRSLLIAGRGAEAETYIAEAQRVWLADATAHRDSLADAAHTLAQLALSRGEMSRAQELIDSALEQFEFPTGARPPGVSAALVTAARIYLRSGDLDKAETFAQAALDLSEATARDPQESADVGEALLVVSQVRRARGATGDLRPSLERAQQALTNGLGPEHRLTREAREALQRALAT